MFDLTSDYIVLDRDCDYSTHFKSLAIQLADAPVRNVRRADSHRSLSGIFRGRNTADSQWLRTYLHLRGIASTDVLRARVRRV